MKVLLTGANGFLGRYVAECLAGHGIATVAIGRHRPDGQGIGSFIEADLLAGPDLDRLADEASASHLIHLAWYVEHGKFWASPLNLRWVDATSRLVEAFVSSGGKHVTIAGTCAEYDWSHGCCVEDQTPLTPSNLYGVAKDATRRLSTAICGMHGVPLAWGRIFLPFGTGEPPGRLVPSLMSSLQGQRPPFSVNGDAERDFLHASELAEAFVQLARQEATGEFNICSGRPRRIADVVRELARLLDADPQPILSLSAERPGDPALLYGTNTRLTGLGWSPRLSLEQGLQRVVGEAHP
jgi:nucleoside-diphosphate-sugar epimerase